MRSRERAVLTAVLGLVPVGLGGLACGGGQGRPRTSGHALAPSSWTSVDGYRLVRALILVREDTGAGIASVSVYFRVNRRLPSGAYATVDGQEPESRVLTRFVPRNDRCYRLDAGGTRRSPWAGVPLGTRAELRLHLRGHGPAVTVTAALRAPLRLKRNANGIGNEGLAYERRLRCLRAGRAR